VTDAPERLRRKLANHEKSVAHYKARIERAAELGRLDVSSLPRRERKAAYSDRVWVEYQVGEEWIPDWQFSETAIENEIRSASHWLKEAEKSLAATQKRLAAAERKAAKAA
jgi:hypothetical protein